ncbi:MAG: alpha/beta hydrolase, partial [Anaerolineae bacterium]|nr:alpha/beta hydrolase [Anaerolineae bacterium]
MSTWREGDLIANGIRLHYYRGQGRGADSGQAVVFCHGFASHALTFGPVARAIQDDYDVVLLDARYHGHS